MASTPRGSANDASANRLVAYLLEKGLGGAGPLSSADNLAEEYLIDQSYRDHDKRVDSLIHWETTKNFTTGFLTGLGGIVSLPAAIPSALGASWLIQARMVGAIARIYGHSLSSDRVRTLVLVALAGDVARDAMSDLGFKSGTRLTQRAMNQVPGRALVEVNKRIGIRLLSKAGQAGMVNFSKVIPLVGGVVGGTFDAVVCRKVGRTAKQLFRPIATGAAPEA